VTERGVGRGNLIYHVTEEVVKALYTLKLLGYILTEEEEA
jgi:hypothetical protein